MSARDHGDRTRAGGPAGETELWLVDLEAAAAALEAIDAATPRLSEASLLQWDAMTADARRERRLAHIALRILLERAVGPGVRGRPFARGSTGKPSLDDAPGTGFSLAHAERFALIAVGPEPLGVDIESRRPVRMTPSRRAPIERAAILLAGSRPLAGQDDDARFLCAWVRLEAVAKAQGSGLAPLLERLRPARDTEGDAAELASKLGDGIVAHDLEVPQGLFAAVALEAGRAPGALATLPATEQGIGALLDRTSRTRR